MYAYARTVARVCGEIDERGMRRIWREGSGRAMFVGWAARKGARSGRRAGQRAERIEECAWKAVAEAPARRVTSEEKGSDWRRARSAMRRGVER